MFRTVPLSNIRSFYCTYSNGICHTGLLTACEQTPDVGQRNCPKHVEFYSKNKFEKLVHVVGFIIRIYHDARSHKRQTNTGMSTNLYRNCPKHVDFYSKNKFEKLVHLLGFIIGIYHDARSHKRQTNTGLSTKLNVIYRWCV